MTIRSETPRFFQKIVNIFHRKLFWEDSLYLETFLAGMQCEHKGNYPCCCSGYRQAPQARFCKSTPVFGTEKSKIVSRTRGLRNHSVFPNLFRSNSIPGLQGYWISLRNLQHEIHNPCILGTTRPNTFCANLKRNSSAHAYLSFAAPSCLSPSQQRSAGTLLVWSRKLSKQ